MKRIVSLIILILLVLTSCSVKSDNKKSNIIKTKSNTKSIGFNNLMGYDKWIITNDFSDRGFVDIVYNLYDCEYNKSHYQDYVLLDLKNTKDIKIYTCNHKHFNKHKGFYKTKERKDLKAEIIGNNHLSIYNKSNKKDYYYNLYITDTDIIKSDKSYAVLTCKDEQEYIDMVESNYLIPYERLDFNKKPKHIDWVPNYDNYDVLCSFYAYRYYLK